MTLIRLLAAASATALLSSAAWAQDGEPATTEPDPTPPAQSTQPMPDSPEGGDPGEQTPPSGVTPATPATPAEPGAPGSPATPATPATPASPSQTTPAPDPTPGPPIGTVPRDPGTGESPNNQPKLDGATPGEGDINSRKAGDPGVTSNQPVPNPPERSSRRRPG